jgi:hypothetical protein
MVPVDGQPRGVRGDIRGHILPLSPRRPLTKPLPPLIIPKEGGIAVTPTLYCRSVVGRRLQDFADFCDTWCPKDSPVPGIIRHGLRLDFVSQPPTTSVPSPVQILPQDSAKASALRAEVKSLQDKMTIFHIDNPGPGFFSHIFVVPQKQMGFWRLINDLSLPVKPVLTGSSTQDGNHQVVSGSDTTRRLGSITGPTGLPTLSLILLRRSSIPVQGYAFRTGLCSANISVNRKGICCTDTHAFT